MYREQIEAYFAEHGDAMLEDICRLVRIPSDKQAPQPGMPYGEGPAKALAEALKMASDMGFSVTNYDNYAGAVDCNDREKQLDILAHLDIVPVADDWTVTGPFEPKIIGGRLYGRGSSDDKGPAVCALYAMKAVKDMGFELKRNVRLILGTDEECGSSDMQYYYTKEKEAPMTFTPDAEFPVINIEKGGLRATISACFPENDALPRIRSVKGGSVFNVIPDKAEAVVEGLSVGSVESYCAPLARETGLSFCVREDSTGAVAICAQGIAGHASTPELANNAVTGILALLSSMPFAVGEGFQRVCALSRLFPHGDWEGAATGIKQEDALSGKLTISLNILNITPKTLSARFDSRCPICASDANMRRVLAENCAAAGLTLSDTPMSPPHHVPGDTPFVRTLLSCYEMYTRQTGRCIAIGGGTYVHHLQNGVAFGCSMPGTQNNIHGADESAVVEELLLSAKIFTQVILELCL